MLCTLALLALAAQEPEAIEKPAAPAKPLIARNLRYAEVKGVEAKFHSLDLYAPATEGPHPIMVMVHGGGWRLGDKANRTMWKDKAPHFVEEGWVYISINYRLTNGEGVPQHPAHIDDVAAAIAWVHDNAAKYQGDPDRIFVMGHSAGAHLAALVATDGRRLAKHGKTLQILNGVVCLDTAGYDIAKYLGEDLAGRTARAIYTNAFGFNPGGWKDASPQHFLGKKRNIPPMLVFHSKERREVANLSQRFVAGLRSIDVPAAAIYASDKNHSGINECIGKKGDPYTALIMRFLAEPRAANSLELASLEPVKQIRLDGPIRLKVAGGAPHEGPISKDWEIVVQIAGKPYAFKMSASGRPQWQLQWELERLADSKDVEIQVTRGPDDAWIDIDGKIERITWQRLRAEIEGEELDFEVLPRPKQQ